MNQDIVAILGLLTIHYIGDFSLQSDWMAVNKSKNWEALFNHVMIYSVLFLTFGFKLWAITLTSHFITDAITSRITAKLWQQEKRHAFFTMIGFDQLLHFYQLILTYWWIYKHG